MSRTINDIYKEAVEERNKRLELKEFKSDSKLSVLNGITWAFAAVIQSFETLLDVFAIDISNAMNNRINGTPAYYANALLQYQKGDTLVVREDGLAFGYAAVDKTKQIITQVSYVESTQDEKLDSTLILKVATGEQGKLAMIPKEELLMINAYINQIKFAGTRINVISREGDVLIPKVTAYYDGAVTEAEVFDNIEEKLNEYIMNAAFDSSVYTSKIMEVFTFHGTVTDNHNLFQSLCIVFHNYFNFSFAFQGYFLRSHTHIREYQCGIGGNTKGETTINIGNSTVAGISFLYYGSTDNGFSRLVCHSTCYGYILR